MNHQSEVIDLFLCHNSADKSWVERLAEHVESETFDGTKTGRQLKVFFDKWDIDTGENVVERINTGLHDARFVAVVISPEFLAAPWTALEWTHVVAGDPANRTERLIPLYLREHSLDGETTCDLPAPFRALNWIDFRREGNFKKNYQRLIRRIRGLRPPRGKRRKPLASQNDADTGIVAQDPATASSPDPVHDVILSNLLPVTAYPRTVWHAPTAARKPKDVWSKVTDAPPFILRDKRLYTFDDLAHPKSALRSVVTTSDIRSIPVASWRKDEIRWRWFIDLLNRSLRNFLGQRGVKAAKYNRYFFVGNKDGTNRSHRNAKDPARDVAARKVNSKDGSVFWVHHGADLTFHTLGDRLFLAVEPCYVFTSNGREPLSGPRVTPLSMKWGGKERNAAILRHIIFWARSLGGGRSRIEFNTGTQPIVLSGLPALSHMSFGIEFDHIALKTLAAQVDDDLASAVTALQEESDRQKAIPAYESEGDSRDD